MDGWQRLQSEGERLRGRSLSALFAAQENRFSSFSRSFEDLVLDFSKEKIDAGALEALFQLAREARLEEKRAALFRGDHINATEDRAVLHMALRGGAAPPPGSDVGETLDRFLAFAETVREGRYGGEAGAFTDVVNIGIGGSDLGPVMVARALEPDRDGPRLHFVSNIDGAQLAEVTRALDPTRTLVIVASKTFTTLETMTNAKSARDWLTGAVKEPGRQMAAVSSNVAAAEAFGIDAERVFGFWDWVGGRYSVWSSIGLPVAIGIGRERFRRFLAGAAAMDGHFREAPLEENLPVLMGLVTIWRRNAMGWPTVALVPYDHRLRLFPAYVQQLSMESNGKRVQVDGRPVAHATGPVVFGEPGTNAQHSFFQLIHQGSDIVPVEFIVAARPRAAGRHAHDLLIANCLAQAQALAFGRTEADVRAEMAANGDPAAEIDRLAAHRTFPGDRPSTMLLHEELSAYALGRLIALYEHKTFVEGAIWNINSFDQWGVELGKSLAQRLIPMVKGEAVAAGGTGDEGGEVDSSTAGLLAILRMAAGRGDRGKA